MQLSEIERAALAVIVQGHQPDALERLHGACFETETNRTLYEALRDLYRAERTFDEPTLVTHLERTANLTKAGGRAGVTALYYHDTALPASMHAYVKDLRDAAHRRALAATLASLSRAASDLSTGTTEVMESIETELLRLRAAADDSEAPITAAMMVSEAMDLIGEAVKRGDGLVGLDTGLPELNDAIGGWEPGTFTIILGQPGVGKTALWLQSALHVARRHPVGMVQLEMTPAKLGMRALANESHVSFRRLRRGEHLVDHDMNRLSQAMGTLANRRILLARNGVDSWPDIKAFYRRCVVDHGAKALFLDNLKIVSLPSAKNELERFNTITRELKLLARSLNVPIVTIHHMHRIEEGRKPTLTSGYGGSSIEQDADNVLALWRPNGDEVADEIEMLPLKTRDDFARARTLLWRGDQQRYDSMLPSDPPPGLYQPS